jgi:hypothetical protein
MSNDLLCVNQFADDSARLLRLRFSILNDQVYRMTKDTALEVNLVNGAKDVVDGILECDGVEEGVLAVIELGEFRS